MNKKRKQRFQDVVSLLEDANNELLDIQSEEIDALESLPESMQMSSRGDIMQEWIDFIDDTMSLIGDVINQIETEVDTK